MGAVQLSCQGDEEARRRPHQQEAGHRRSASPRPISLASAKNFQGLLSWGSPYSGWISPLGGGILTRVWAQTHKTLVERVTVRPASGVAIASGVCPVLQSIISRLWERVHRTACTRSSHRYLKTQWEGMSLASVPELFQMFSRAMYFWHS